MHNAVLAAAAIAIACLAGSAIAQGAYKEVESPGAHTEHSAAYRSDTIDVPLKAAGDTEGGHEVEYMVRMKKGDVLVYSWEGPAGATVWHELHGHTADAVTFYKKAEGLSHHGALSAPFDGEHGWYFENRGKTAATVRVKLAGYYELVAP